MGPPPSRPPPPWRVHPSHEQQTGDHADGPAIVPLPASFARSARMRPTWCVDPRSPGADARFCPTQNPRPVLRPVAPGRRASRASHQPSEAWWGREPLTGPHRATTTGQGWCRDDPASSTGPSCSAENHGPADAVRWAPAKAGASRDPSWGAHRATPSRAGRGVRATTRPPRRSAHTLRSALGVCAPRRARHPAAHTPAVSTGGVCAATRPTLQRTHRAVTTGGVCATTRPPPRSAHTPGSPPEVCAPRRAHHPQCTHPAVTTGGVCATTRPPPRSAGP
ncbi:MAG: hypothetical protein JWM89_2500 [Acidimicrobiales bacterium]|nr:hypothetical protein [Acidimicrobiales bacterium]